jgi:hypothetical protein
MSNISVKPVGFKDLKPFEMQVSLQITAGELIA